MNQRTLLPARAMWTRFGVCSRTLSRWSKNPDLGLPRPIVINGRRYWEAEAVDAWELQQSARAR